jgi:hypothetical protein
MPASQSTVPERLFLHDLFKEEYLMASIAIKPPRAPFVIFVVFLVVIPVSVQAQVRPEDRPGPAPERPSDRPALTAPERARSAEVSEAPGLHFKGEGYAAVFGGVTIGHEFSDAKLTGPLAGTNLGDRNLLNSGVYGAKIG